MVVSSISTTSRPLFQVVQHIFNFQKQNFKISAIARSQKRTLSSKSNSSVLSEQSARDVSTASDGNQQQFRSAPSYSSDKVTRSDHATSSSVVGGSHSHADVMGMPKQMHRFPTNTNIHSQFQNTFDTTGTAKPTAVLQDLQADLSNQGLNENLSSKENSLLPVTGELQMPTSGHVDPTTMQQVFYFDTLACMKRLEAKGFTRNQAEACVECLVEIINSTLDHQAKHMITKSQQEIAVQQLLSEIISVKKDMVLLQKSEFSSLRSETEKIGIDMNRIETHFQDEVVKLKGQFSLDINLERGRAVEAHAENEKNLQLLHNKIDTEIANLKTTYEIYRNDVIKFAGGTVLTCATLILGFIRLWK